MNIPFILNSIQEIGDDYAAKFKAVPVPATQEGFMELFDNIEPDVLNRLKEKLQPLYPGIPWVEGSEFDFDEQKAPLSSDEYWLCDSMDGAVQYIQHLPGWTINLVLIRNGRPYFSAIYDPAQKEMFWAIEGKGAFINDQPIKVLSKKDSAVMLAHFNHPPVAEGVNKRTGAAAEKLLSKYGVLRNYGPCGLQLALVGAGRIDVFYEDGLDTYNWLPGLLIAKEAGAELSTIDGREWSWGEDSLFVAAPGVIKRFLE